jgi:tetratricopeptide (TPR) repeat protein
MAQISLRGYNREIESLIDRGQIDEAIAHCKHILKNFPKHIGTYRLLGKCYLETQRYIEAADILQRVLTVFPDDFISQIGMSIIREDEGNLESAIWHMERAFEVQPSNSAVQGEIRRLFNAKEGVEPPKVRLTHGALIRMYAKSELHQQAIAEAKTALAEDADRVDLEVILAKMYYQIGQKAEAAEVCTNILKNLEYCFDANKILSEVMLTSNRTEDAKVFQQRIAAVDPYAAYLTAEITNSDEVDEKMVMVEKLEWQASEYESQRRTRILGVDTQELVNFSQEPEENFNSVRTFDQDSSDKTVAIPKSSVPLSEYQQSPSGSEEFKPVESITPPEPEKFTTPQENASSQQETLPINMIEENQQEENPPELQGIQSIPELSEPVGEVLPASDASTENEALPDWMKSAGWAVSDGTTPETPVVYDQSEGIDSGPIQPAEIPDWLQSLAPEETEAPTQEDQEKMDLLNRILPPQPETSEEAVPSLESNTSFEKTEKIPEEVVSEDRDIPISVQLPEDVPTSKMDAAIPEVSDEEAVKEELPDWLKTTAQPIEQRLPLSDIESEVPEGLPDWLRMNNQTTENVVNPEQISELNPSPVEEYRPMQAEENIPDLSTSLENGKEEAQVSIPSWSPEEASKSVEVPVEDTPSLEPAQDLDLESSPTSNVENTPEWLQDIKPTESTSSFPTSDSLPEWLKEEPVSENKSSFPASPERLEGQESPPEWLRESDDKKTNEDSQPSKISARVDEQLSTFFDSNTESQPPIDEIPSPPPIVPEWLKEVANTSGLSDLDNEILPSWAKDTNASPESSVENIDHSSDEVEAHTLTDESVASSEPIASTISEENVAKEELAPSVSLDEDVQAEVIAELPIQPGDSSNSPIETWLENLNKEESKSEEKVQGGTETSPIFEEFSHAGEITEIKTDTETNSNQPDQPLSLESQSEMRPLSDETLVSKPFSEPIVQNDVNNEKIPSQPLESSEEIGATVLEVKPEEPTIQELPVTEKIADIAPALQPIDTPVSIEEPLLETPEMIDDSISAGSDLDLESWLNSLEEVSGPAVTPEIISPTEEAQIQIPAAEGTQSPVLDSTPQPEVASPLNEQVNTSENLEPIIESIVETTPPESELIVNQSTAGWLEELNVDTSKEQISPEVISETIPLENDDTQIGRKAKSDQVINDKTEPSITFEDILNHANEAMGQGNIQDALKKYSILIKSGEKIEETIRDLRSAVYKHPSDVAIWQTLGDGYARNNRLQEALDAYTKAEELLK